MTARTIPAESSVAYRAAELIHRSGTIPRADLLSLIEFSERACNCGASLSKIIRSGWLTETHDGVMLSDISRHHFGPSGRVKSDYVGQVAAPRTPLVPLYERPALSAKYRVSSKGFRDDVPAYSVREGVRFSTLGGRSV